MRCFICGSHDHEATTGGCPVTGKTLGFAAYDVRAEAERAGRLAILREVREMVSQQRDVIAGLVLGLNGKAGQMRADGAFAALETTVANVDALIAREEQK